MKLIALAIFTVLISTDNSFGQKYSLYSNDSLLLTSEYLREPITLNLHLPETFRFSAETTKYPITIVFDSQHERTYPQIINSFDLLTSETQVPESIIIGVPFDRYNRYYRTSNQTLDGDSLMGIERMERFLFEELIPKLKKEYHASDFICIIGHSRTAYLVNYLASQRPREINTAIALSGFYNEPPLSVEAFHSFLTTAGNFSHPLNYYSAVGTTLEEVTYDLQCSKLDSLIQTTKLPKTVNVQFSKTEHANHMSNYWVSLPPILMDAFTAYNDILDTWFHEKLKSGFLDEDPVTHYRSDLAQASQQIGTELLPSLTHIYSLASYFGYEKENYTAALNFFELGLSYYPEFLEFYIDMIEFATMLDDLPRAEHYRKDLREKAQSSELISESLRQEILEYLDSGE